MHRTKLREAGARLVTMADGQLVAFYWNLRFGEVPTQLFNKTILRLGLHQTHTTHGLDRTLGAPG